MSKRNPNHDLLSDESNKGTTKRWCPKAEEYTKTQKEMHNEDIAVLWKENFIQLAPWNHGNVYRSILQEVHN